MFLQVLFGSFIIYNVYSCKYFQIYVGTHPVIVKFVGSPLSKQIVLKI